ncbi:MAG: MMPL family transporter [Planctomycetaceae bacterium]|nr:MMPL family transporter [Planctomycetaceae bacterium]
MLARCLGGIVGISARRPRLVLWCMVLLGCASVGITISDLRLKASRSDLLAPDATWKDYSNAFGGDSDLVVVARTQTADPQLLQKVLDQLGERLKREPDTFSNVLYKLDQASLRSKALQFLTVDELQTAIRRVDGFSPVLKNRQWDLLRIEKLADQLNRNAQSGSSAESAVQYSDRLADSLNSFMTAGTGGEAVQMNTQGFKSPWPEIVEAGIEHTAQDTDLAYLMNDGRNVGMLHVMPSAQLIKAERISIAIDRLREHLREIEGEYQKVAPELSLSVTGIPVLEHDELRRSGRDMINAALVALVAVGLLLAFGLRGLRHPMLVLIMLVLSMALTFGVATLAVGHLNVLSICFVAILIGLGVDFGIHFVTRYLFLRQELYEIQESLVLAGNSVGTGIMTSAATTAVAFGSAALTGFTGLQELGIITAAGIMICAWMTVSFLPALIAVSDESVEVDELPVPRNGKMWRVAVVGFPTIAILLAAAGIGALGWQAASYKDGAVNWHVKYNSNLMQLQDENLRSVQAEQTLANADNSLLYAVSVADSPEKAMVLRTQFAALPSVGRVTDLSSRLPAPPQGNQKQLIQTLASRLNDLPKSAPALPASNPETVGLSLDRLYKTLRQSTSLEAHRAADHLDQFLNRLAALPASQQTAVIDAYQNLMVSALLKDFYQVAQATSLDPVTLQDLPADWRSRYLRVDGDRQLHLIKVFPRASVWDDEALTSFVRDVRTVDPTVSGVPVKNYESAVRLWECYQGISLYALAAIALFMLFDFLRPGQKLLTVVPPLLVVGFVGYNAMNREGSFNLNMLVAIYLAMVAFVAAVFDIRNLRDTLLALVPPVGGGIMMLGIMALLGVDFNPLNLIALPLVFGLGVDGGIHLVHDYRRQLAESSEEYSPSGDTVNGVLLTSLTSIVGFGSLMVSAHRGLQSLGVVLAIGIACCLAVSLILIPPVLVLVARHQPASLEPVIIPKPKAESTTDSSGGNAAASQPSGKASRKEQGGKKAA